MKKLFLLLGLALSAFSQTTVNYNTDVRFKPIISVLDWPYSARCDGFTNDRVAIQAAMDAAAGKELVIPEGKTCLLAGPQGITYPVFLTLSSGTRVSGKGTLKLANGVGDYYTVIGNATASCDNCQVTDITIDHNIAGNPLTTETKARAAIILAGNNIYIHNTHVTNSSGIWGIVSGSGSKRVIVTDNVIDVFGDDANHVYHDTSAFYLIGEQVTATGNTITGVSLGAAAVTAIETHATQQVVSNNNIRGFKAGINVTGSDVVDSEASVVCGNSIAGAYVGIAIWSGSYATHTSGYGDNGLNICNNSIRLNQTIYPNNTQSFGIMFVPGDLPVRNININNNTIVFDLEQTPRCPISCTASIGIGAYDQAYTGTDPQYSNITISENIIENAPVAGIKLTPRSSMSGIVIRNNTLINPGSTTDTTPTSNYKNPLYLYTSGAGHTLQAIVENNQLIDDLTTSRMTNMGVFGGDTGSSLELRNNTVYFKDIVHTSWGGYFTCVGAIVPLVKLTTLQVAWNDGNCTYRSGSKIYDATVNKDYFLVSDGTGWLQVPDVTQLVSYGTVENLFTVSDPLLADFPTKTAGIGQATTNTCGAHGFTIPAVGAQQDFAYQNLTLASGTYAMSACIIMDDASAPVPKTDFWFAIGNTRMQGTYTVTLVSGNAYLVSVYGTINSASTDSGIVRLSGDSGKGFTITNFQLNRGTVPNPLTSSIIERNYLQSNSIRSGNNVVYRCTTAGTLPLGALTLTSGDCGASTDTGIKVK